MDAETSLSSKLLAANRRLAALRQQSQNNSGSTEARGYLAGGKKETLAPTTEQSVSPTARPLANAISCQPNATLAIPSHLGWGSGGVTVVLRRQQEAVDRDRLVVESERLTANNYRLLTSNYQPKTSLPDWVKLYPDIGLAMLRRELTAPGRLWLLLRLLDGVGEGKLRIVRVEETITGQNSPHRLCGQRQLRNLLKAGEGLFWTRDRNYLWLRSAAKVAYGLGVTRLTGRPVALPLSALLGGIRDFRAHLYSAFHSGRSRAQTRGVQSKPIARQTLASLSGVGRSSQRSYERQTGVAVTANYAVGEVATNNNREERAWRQGTAVFELTDHKGQQGKPGQTYLAWQLPNSYDGRHSQQPKGRQRRINRELKDLVMKGMPGNVEQTDEATRYGHGYSRVFYAGGGQAAKAYGRDPRGDRYWPTPTDRCGQRRWQRLGS